MKAAASLTASLLARKGAAYPASYSAPNSAPTKAGNGQEAFNSADVVRSGMPTTHHTPSQGPQMQDGRFVEDLEAPETAASMPSGAAAELPESDANLPQAMDKMGRVRLSVRLDPDRYLRVKMASARTRWSAQDIVIAALDRYLDGSASKSADKNQKDYDEDLN